jgi:bifunctional non-homologous end joining protein LigD
MKAVAGELPADEDGWAFEIKWDGMRILSFVDGGRVGLQSANLIDVTIRFPELASLHEAVATRTAVLDGEVVVFDDEGRPSFGRLQPRMHLASAREARQRSATSPVCYLLFDVLHADGEDTTVLPYVDRRRLLTELVEPAGRWQVPAYHVGEGAHLLEATGEQGLEGLVAKRLDSRYEIGRRSPTWRKMKVRREQEFVVGGWQAGEGNREGRLGSLLVGYYDGDRLRYAGKVGTGFTFRELGRLAGLLAPLAVDASPFDPEPPRLVARVAHWVRPELVAQVAFGEWTQDDILRHPAYLGLRDDKDAREVTRDP